MSAPTLEHLDPRTLVIAANVRTHARLDPDFVRSIRENGVLTPITVLRAEDGTTHVRAGQRRTLAAVEADLPTIPAYVIVGGDDEATRIVEQFTENHHGRPLTAAEDAAAFEQLALLGLSPTAIAKRTATKKARVEQHLTVAQSPAAAAVTAKYDLTIDQAAVIAEFDDDPEVVKALTVTAVKDPGQFDHVAQQERDRRADVSAVAALVADLAGRGIKLTDDPDSMTSLTRLIDGDGNDLDAETHGTCPGHVGRVVTQWDGPKVIYGCADPEEHGHRDRWATSTGGGQASTGKASDEDAKEERRRVIANNKAWRSAETVRREWLATFAQRKTAPKDANTYLLTALTSTGAVLDLDKAGREQRHALARTWLGLPEATGGYYASDSAFMDAAAKASPARAQMIALVVLLAATEAQTDVHTWRNATAHVRTYLQALEHWGYGLSPVEALAVGDQE